MRQDENNESFPRSSISKIVWWREGESIVSMVRSNITESDLFHRLRKVNALNLVVSFHAVAHHPLIGGRGFLIRWASRLDAETLLDALSRI